MLPVWTCCFLCDWTYLSHYPVLPVVTFDLQKKITWLDTQVERDTDACLSHSPDWCQPTSWEFSQPPPRCLSHTRAHARARAHTHTLLSEKGFEGWSYLICFFRDYCNLLWEPAVTRYNPKPAVAPTSGSGWVNWILPERRLPDSAVMTNMMEFKYVSKHLQSI